MNRLVVLSFFIVVSTQLAALALPDRRLVLWASGAASAAVVLAVRRMVGREVGSDPAPIRCAQEEALRGWLARTETLIHRSESTRADWDRHLRPLLARRFAATTGQRQAKDPATFSATGLTLFGPQLWTWVDPNNVSRTGRREPGPGRATLEAILARLEQV
ncbi:hypothetical protein [Mycobacterium sp.]|uniref:hypothetical protein n=1 Tax=Mycobacterium sp. TaxID=1785 RepID=UPI001288B8AD|nr:hypothetical protein [Mycobacterium sp.]KAA8960857.1 MAG: hypothetical protein F6Q13_13185 [Mycobacterium sp.]